MDLQFLKKYCEENGTLRQMLRGESLEEMGQPSRWIGYIRKGCFKYFVHNKTDGKDYITGFAFEGEFVADYPNCLYGRSSQVTIEANMPCELYVIDGKVLARIYEQNLDMMCRGKNIIEALFMQTYERFLDHYRLDTRSQYERLMSRCPQVVQQLSLKDIASFLNITPQMLSKIRKDITFGPQL